MASSTRKISKDLKAIGVTDISVLSSAEETPNTTRRSTRLASKRKSDTVNLLISSEDEPTQGPTPKRIKSLPVRPRGSPVKVAIEIPIQRAQDRHNAAAVNEVVKDEAPKSKKAKEGQKELAVLRVEDSDSENQEFHDANERLREDVEQDTSTKDDLVIGEKAATPKSSKSRRKSKQETPSKPLKTTPTPKSQAKKMVFDDDYDFSAATKKAKAGAPTPETLKPADDVDDYDDDEAPEDEDIQKGPSKAEFAQKAALKATEEQAAQQKRKRQERDALFKKQANERKAAALVVTTDVDVEMDISGAPLGGRKRYDRSNIPDILPAELLTDSEPDSDDNDMSAPSPAKRQRKMITFDDAQRAMDRKDKKQSSRDKRVGDTVFRTSKKDKDESKLAPKIVAGSSSGRLKQELLMRRRNGVVKKNRNGFFKK